MASPAKKIVSAEPLPVWPAEPVTAKQQHEFNRAIVEYIRRFGVKLRHDIITEIGGVGFIGRVLSSLRPDPDIARWEYAWFETRSTGTGPDDWEPVPDGRQVTGFNIIEEKNENDPYGSGQREDELVVEGKYLRPIPDGTLVKVWSEPNTGGGNRWVCQYENEVGPGEAIACPLEVSTCPLTYTFTYTNGSDSRTSTMPRNPSGGEVLWNNYPGLAIDNEITCEGNTWQLLISMNDGQYDAKFTAPNLTGCPPVDPAAWTEITILSPTNPTGPLTYGVLS